VPKTRLTECSNFRHHYSPKNLTDASEEGSPSHRRAAERPAGSPSMCHRRFTQVRGVDHIAPCHIWPIPPVAVLAGRLKSDTA
jgi:hypothetical protein